MDKLRVIDVIESFNLNVVNKGGDSSRVIGGPAIQRSGLELSGSYKSEHSELNVVGWGTKENHWLSSLTEEKAIEAISHALTSTTPMVILSKGIKGKIKKLITKVSDKMGVVVVETDLHLSTITSTLGWYLALKFAETVDVHGSLVIINGVGVMIIGQSGIGKSEAVLELIQNGHSFVSDDTVVLKRVGKQFYGSPSPLTAGLLEARGIGIVNMPHIYGQRMVKDQTNVELVVELMSHDKLNQVDRLGIADLKYEALRATIDKIQIPVHNGRSIAALVEAATNVYLARKSGIDPLEEIRKRRT